MKESKKFVANSMADAFKMIKQQFGHDAIILSHDYQDGKVQVVAMPAARQRTEETIFEPLETAVETRSTYDLLSLKRPESSLTPLQAQAPLSPTDNQENALNQVIKSEFEALRALLKETFEKSGAKSPTLAPLPSELSEDLKSELDAIKTLLKNQISNPIHTAAEIPVRQGTSTLIRAQLLQMRLTPVMVNQIVSDLASDVSLKDAWEQVIENLVELMDFDPHYLLPQKKIKAFIGPSGSGKTQSMAKLIAHFMKNGLDGNFSLIFANHSNIKVLEESRAFGRIFNVPAYYVESYEELEDAYIESLDKDYIFMDLPSFDFNNPENNYPLKFLQTYPHDIDNTFVISSGVSLGYIQKHFSLYQNIDFDGLTITKLNENDSCEEIIEYGISSKIPFRNLSFGQDFSSRFIFGDKRYFVEHFKKSFLSSNHDASKESVNNEKWLCTITPKNGQNSGGRSDRRQGWGRKN